MVTALNLHLIVRILIGYYCNILSFIPDVAAMEERQTLDPTVENIQQSAQGNVSRPPPLGASWLLAPKLVLLRAKPDPGA